MVSYPAATSTQYQYADASPLEQIMNGNQTVPPRHALLDRAMTLTRKTTVTSRNSNAEDERLDNSNRVTGSHKESVLTNSNVNYGYALGDEEDQSHAAKLENSRQKVQNLRAARLDRQKSKEAKLSMPNTTGSLFSSSQPATDLNGNIFQHTSGSSSKSHLRDGMVEGDSSREDIFGAVEHDPDRIAEAVRGLALRRRQSIDTVRSSEFAEGGRWDRAWGGSDEDEDDDEDIDFILNHNNDLTDFEIEGGLRRRALDQFEGGQWQKRDSRPTMGEENHQTNNLPILQDSSGVKHTVSLTPSTQRTKKLPVHPSSTQDYLTEAGSQSPFKRRDTVTSMMGDIGQISPTPSRQGMHHYSDSNATLSPSTPHDHRISQSGNSPGPNAHVFVWPPTPAASLHGGSNEGSEQQHGSNPSNRDTLSAYPAGVGIGQSAMIEYANGPLVEYANGPLVEYANGPLVESPVSHPTTIHSMSPSAALARPLDSPILGSNGSAIRKQKSAARISSGSGEGGGSGHPTGRLPPGPPAIATGQEVRYFDPNKPLPDSPYAELGKMRRKAIEDRDGRESMVSDLDVETLRLDGGSAAGDSDEWNSRRGSNISLGSFSSEKIQDQRMRRSQASVTSSYSDKRSSSGTIQARSALSQNPRQSWSGGVRTGRDAGPSRSNTGPDDYPVQARAAQQHTTTGYLAQQSLSPSSATAALVSSPKQSSKFTPSTANNINGVSLTFSTPPRPDREAVKRDATVSVKGAISNSPAERFLTLAISHHESGDLSRSAYYFERSAKVEGGCIVGMCMWGLALREGWGVRKDQKKGFEWISKAASKAGEMMAGQNRGGGGDTAAKSDSELKAIRSELKLSVYELGKCFCYGWGVKMDKAMALEYFELAAKLGDSLKQKPVRC
jgi:TPR repeat protein